MTGVEPALRERLSSNHGPRAPGAPVDMLIVHYTGMASVEAALDRMCDPATEVSAHYLIAEDGALWRLVPEDRRAWHAGLSFWAGERDINSRSIGIELANPGHGPDYRAFPEAQMRALAVLARGILSRHEIPPHRILGHSDVAPDRKLDPGELFDWQRLAADGIGLWPTDIRPERIDDAKFAARMRRFGYADASESAVAAFQRHFHPAGVTGIADDETRVRLIALLRSAGLE